jgi:transglutaminase-like putative cysteine protease
MRGLSADARRDLPLAAVAAATTWLTMLSWRGFSDLWGQFLGPLIVVAMAVPVAGVLLRAAPLPRRTGAFLQVLVIAVLVWLMLGGSPIHPFSSTHDLADRVADAWTTAETYQPPIPSSLPSLAPLLIPCGALALLVVDLLACWLRRVPLAGLPLLAVYCVPISVIGSGVSWLVFLFAAGGFLLMMFLHESAHITRWGRPLGGPVAAAADPQGFGVRNGASRASATTVGSVAVVLAVILPVFIPTLHLDGLGLFGPGGSGDGVKVVNPTANMQRNLHRGKNVPLLNIKTDDPNPSYLRIAVLNEFNGVEWTSGNRSIISDQTASGLLPYSEQGLADNVPTDPHNYQVTATRAFDSSWLPTQFPALSVTAQGDWHWDGSTMDFIASNDSTNAAGLSWNMSSLNPQLSSYSMINSLTPPLSIQEPYTALPTTLPPYIKSLAQKVTKGGGSRFEAAVMLQDWFRTRFRYSLKTRPGDGSDALMQFLSPGKGHRVGYCEQFAAAFAVMARTLDMPSRVAIGFLSPTKTGTDRYVYSAHDMHAWPEVYFRGSGWVRFEPTPAIRTGQGGTPSYTRGPVRKPHNPKDGPSSGGGRFTTDPTGSAAANKGLPTSQTHGTDTGTSVPWMEILAGLLVLGLLAAIGLVPGAIRRARRRRRLVGGVEDAWLELRDSALDLGVGWPAGRSPHETGYLLSAWFGPEPDGAPLVRPPRGRGIAPGAEDALDRIVLTLERVRYARHAEDIPGGLADDVHTCITSLEHGCTRAALRRARWFPRSLFGRARRAAAQAELERAPEAVAAGGVVDHVG